MSEQNQADTAGGGGGGEKTTLRIKKWLREAEIFKGIFGLRVSGKSALC